jgi:heptaprenylglyceryl phosphate synthase
MTSDYTNSTVTSVWQVITLPCLRFPNTVASVTNDAAHYFIETCLLSKEITDEFNFIKINRQISVSSSV